MKKKRNTVILIALTQTLYLLSSCRVETPQALKAVPGATTNASDHSVPSAEEVFHLRSECAQLGVRMLDGRTKDDVIGENQWNQLSHYDPQSNRCYVEISSTTSDRTKPYIQSMDELYDGQTGEQLATLLYTGKNCPSDPCKAVGTTPPEHKICTGCTSSEDAENYIREKMNDPHN